LRVGTTICLSSCSLATTNPEREDPTDRESVARAYRERHT
jgi:hypothetical protein